MKITVQHFQLTKRYPLTISRGTSAGSENLLVEIEHEGVTGIGEMAPTSGGAYAETAETAEADIQRWALFLEEASPWDWQQIERVWEEEGGGFAARAALDMALHDWQGKRLGVPVWKLLGADPTTSPYTSVTIGIATVDVLRERVAEMMARLRPKALKVKLGSPNGIDADKIMFYMVQQMVSTPVSWRVDANGGWSVKDALQMMPWLADRGVEFIEQPLPRGHEEDLPQLFENRALPLFLDESLYTATDLPALAHTIDGVNLKLMKCGGLREAMRIIHTARAHRLQLMIGCMSESSLAITAAAHLGAFVDYLDLDSHLNLMPDPYTGAAFIEGRLVPPQRPGLGVYPMDDKAMASAPAPIQTEPLGTPLARTTITRESPSKAPKTTLVGRPPELEDRRLAILMHNYLLSGYGKMGLGLLRYSEDEIVAVVDQEHAGQNITTLTGIPRQVPILRSVIEAARKGANTLVLGVATAGGVIPNDWWPEIEEGLAAGMSLINGLHTPLADHPDLASLLWPGRVIWDVRQEPPGLSNGLARAAFLSCQRVLTVGTDMAIGKMTTSLELDKAARRRGIRSQFLASGQIGICIAGEGVPLDAVRVDFASGAVEAMVLQHAPDHDLLSIEGQGSILHPASTAWLPLIRGACPTHLILCHRYGQNSLARMESVRIPPMKEVIALYEAVCSAAGALFPAKVVGISLHCRDLDEASARYIMETIADDTGLPVTDVVRFGAEPLLNAIR